MRASTKAVATAAATVVVAVSVVEVSAEALGVATATAVAGMAEGALNPAPPPLIPIITVPEPATTTLPWLPAVPTVVAGMPLISTVGIPARAGGPPQAEGSPWRAAGRPSNSTLGEPAAIGLLP